MQKERTITHGVEILELLDDPRAALRTEVHSMNQLIPSLAALVESFQDCFHPSVFPTFQALLAGWIVCLGPRTINQQPRPEDVVLGRPPRGGRSRGEAPVGGGPISRAQAHSRAAEPSRSRRLRPGVRPSSLNGGSTRRYRRAGGSSDRVSDRGAKPGGTPDRSKLFGSHGQMPWLHDGVKPRPKPALRGPRTGIGAAVAPDGRAPPGGENEPPAMERADRLPVLDPSQAHRAVGVRATARSAKNRP